MLGEGSRRPGWPPAAPSGGRLWHGSAVRRPLLGGGGEALTFGRPESFHEVLSNRPIQTALPPDGRGMRRKATAIGFFTERTLAAYLAVSDRTIRNWIRRGELPSYKLGASRRIDPADVEDFLARRRDEAA
jgi:excisionase family DNA binding protein